MFTTLQNCSIYREAKRHGTFPPSPFFVFFFGVKPLGFFLPVTFLPARLAVFALSGEVIRCDGSALQETGLNVDRRGTGEKTRPYRLSPPAGFLYIGSLRSARQLRIFCAAGVAAISKTVTNITQPGGVHLWACAKRLAIHRQKKLIRFPWSTKSNNNTRATPRGPCRRFCGC